MMGQPLMGRDKFRRKGNPFLKTFLGKVQVQTKGLPCLFLTSLLWWLRDSTITLAINLSKEEIKVSVFNLGSIKVPRPNDILGYLFQHFWHIVKKEIIVVVKEFQETKVVPKDVNSTFISLVHKAPRGKKFSKFFPISLCNFMYKVMSKVLSKRLKCILPFIIGPHQGGFVNGWQICFGVITIHEIAHSIMNFGREGIMLKLDVSKAYDRVEFSFWLHMLIKFGFRKDWIVLKKECISSMYFFVLINRAMDR